MYLKERMTFTMTSQGKRADNSGLPFPSVFQGENILNFCQH